MAQLQAGTRINNYLLDEPVGGGSFGEVWRAHHHVFNETVAIKIPTDPQYVRHLRREGLAVHGIRHPNIVRVIDLDPYADPAYLVMEYVDGPSVDQLIKQYVQGLPLDAVVVILWGTVSALAAAHGAGVIHRDIKPANILVAGGTDLSGLDPQQIKVTDFGLRCLSDQATASMLQSGSIGDDRAGGLAGTLVYMSPEQRDGQEVDARTDLYSVGVVLHEMLTGMLPQGTDLPGSIRKGIPRWLDNLFERLYTRRDHRLASAEEMLDIIDRYGAASWPGKAVSVTAAAHGAGRNGPRCPQCGERPGPDDQFCIHCGQQLIEEVPRCPTCHAYPAKGDKFCVLCGANLNTKA